jgi:hypothetical protein
VIPDDLAALNIHDVGDVVVPLLPCDLVDAHIPRLRYRGEFLPCQFLKILPVDPVDHFVVKAEIPSRFLIGRDSGEAVYLIGKALGESTAEPVKSLNADTAMTNAARFSFGNVEKYSLPADGKILHHGHPDAVHWRIVNTAAAGTDCMAKCSLLQNQVETAL